VRSSPDRSKQVLHVGCGHPEARALHRFFRADHWKEVRLDIDPGCGPDIVASITDMPGVADGSFDALYSSHNIEHVYPHEVADALGEFRRVLREDGFAMVFTPDLQSIAALVAAGKLEETAYVSPAGPIAPIDVIYGLRPALAQGNMFMAHKTGFTAATLNAAMLAAGFESVVVLANEKNFELCALAYPAVLSQEELQAEIAEKLGGA